MFLNITVSSEILEYAIIRYVKNESYMYFTERIDYRFHERRKPVGKLWGF